jgi:S-adenosylmethionine decarboxylase
MSMMMFFAIAALVAALISREVSWAVPLGIRHLVFYPDIKRGEGRGTQTLVAAIAKVTDDVRRPLAGRKSAYSPGRHDVWDFHGIAVCGDAESVKAQLCRAANACGATLLSVHSHGFGMGSGYTAVALLAESHITVHTWPETGVAAIDAFLCGDMDADGVREVFERYYRPARIKHFAVDRCNEPSVLESEAE